MSRYATRFNKRDVIEPSILQTLARLGVEWIEAGPLDGWVYLASRWVPVEIKTGNARFTEEQEVFIADCQRLGRPCVVWRSVKEAIESVETWRQRA